MSMLDFAIRATTEYIDHMPKSQRKKYGQFFTSKETAVFMPFGIDRYVQLGVTVRVAFVEKFV